MTTLPPELAALAAIVDAQPEPVRAAFQYCLALVLRADRLTQVRVEALGYQPWQLALRGGAAANKKMEGLIRLVPVRPTGPEA
jgi:hypothetical protein